MAKPKVESSAAQQLRLLRELDYASNPEKDMLMPGTRQRLIAETLAVLLRRTYKETPNDNDTAQA